MRSTANYVEMINKQHRAHVRFSHVFVGITVLSFALLPIALGSDSPVAADFGDAPDGHSAGYPPPFSVVVGNFPTSFVTGNSRFGQPGGHTLTTSQEWLGPMVSAEFGPDDPADPDTIENFIDDDLDDGWITGPCASATPAVPFPNPLLTTLTFQVSIAPNAPPGPRFINVLIDKDHNGTWNSLVTPEWVVIDFPVTIPPGTTAAITVGPFPLGLTPAGTWMRVSLTRTRVVGSFVDDGTGWDGSGAFGHGEIEDYIFANSLAIASAAASAAKQATAVATDMDFDLDIMTDQATDFEAVHAHATALVAVLAAVDVSVEVTAAAAAAASAAVSAADAASDEASASASAAIAAALCVEAQEIAEAFVAVCAVCPCASACASASGSATASALACASAAAAASASADASASASAEVSAAAAAAASAFAQASAQASAFAFAFALAQAQADAIAFAHADAVAFALAFANAAATASAQASAASSAAAAALSAACGQNAQAAAGAMAQANANAAAAAAASADAFAFAFAFADAFAFAHAQVQAIAFAFADAQVAASAAAAASAQAQASASAAAFASASASASASIAGFVAISVEATVEASASASASATASCTGDCCDGCEKTCPLDTFGGGPNANEPDGEIGAGDLANLLGQWGLCDPPPDPPGCQSDAGCSDGDPCTTDTCGGDGNCQHEPASDGTGCDDGNACTTEDACIEGQCAGGPELICPEIVCMDLTCNPAVGCVTTPNQDPCDDGNACTTNDTCAGGQCVGGPQHDSDDGNPCTDDSCDPETGPVNTPNEAPCDDGDACTTQDTCTGGECAGGPDLECNDSNPCTTDSCDSASGCVNEPNDDASCDDADECTQGDTCVGGECTPGPPVSCPDDGNPCTATTCAPGVGCVSTPINGVCDDDNGCTANDTCIGEVCHGQPIVCVDDGDPCTEGTCDPANGQCVFVPIEPCCGNGIREEGEECDGGDAPDCPGQCQPDCRCPGILDVLTTCGGLDLSSVLFGGPEIPAIPADFFGAGSEPFEGDVCLFGEFGEADTLVRRLADPFELSDPPGPEVRTTPIELVQLSLVSCEPITVVIDNADTFWDVEVSLSDVPPPPGALEVVKTHCNGGTFTATLSVIPRFTFTRTDVEPPEIRVVEGDETRVFSTGGAAPWVHQANPALGLQPSIPPSNFVPGVEEDPPCNGDLQQQVVPFTATSCGGGIRHCVGPAQGGGGQGDCCVPNGTPGCDDPECELGICQFLPQCCDGEWDEQCAGAASKLCPNCAGGGSDCCVQHDFPGCADPKCQQIVCIFAPLCCDGPFWDQACVQFAIDFCGICGP